MEFTTHFGLRSQATRLPGGWRTSRVRCREGPYTLDGAKGHDHEDLGTETANAARLPNTTFPAPREGRGDSVLGYFLLHSPLLEESSLVSFPPLTDMLKFSGYSRLI